MPGKKKPKGKMIASNRYNKTSFSEKWSEIINDKGNQIRGLTEEDLLFVKSALQLINKYQRILSDPRTKLAIRSQSFQGYPVNGLVIITPNSKNEIWVGKKKIVDALFPPTRVKKRSHKSVVARAFRQVVEEQMRKERDHQRRQAFVDETKLCPLSGIPLKDCEKTELDHVYPFIRLMEDFLREKALPIDSVRVNIRGTHYRLADDDLLKEWYNYHRANAKLSLVCAKDNRSKGKKYDGDYTENNNGKKRPRKTQQISRID